MAPHPEQTLLVEQRLIEGEIVSGQKVRHFRPRAVDLVAPLKQDLAEQRREQLAASGLASVTREGEGGATAPL
jgi:hypothetical protein